MKYTQILFIALLLQFFVLMGSAESFEIQPVHDSFIDSLNPDENYGNNLVLKTYSASNGHQKTYLTFYVPEYVDSAFVNVYLENYDGSSFKIYRTTADWNESTITYNDERPIIESNVLVDEIPYSGTKQWYSFDVSSVVTDPGYYSFYIATSWGYKNEFNSTEAEVNQPYMQVNTIGSKDDFTYDFTYNSKTKNSSYAFIVDKGEEITFSIDAPNSENIGYYNWYVNKEEQAESAESFNFIVPVGDILQPSSCIWEIRVEGVYDNGTQVVREWLISTLTEDQAPDFIDFFIDRDNRWRTSYVLDPWGRQLPSYDQETNFISQGYYSGSLTGEGKILSSKFDITDGTYDLIF
jgi:hypothetical protein